MKAKILTLQRGIVLGWWIGLEDFKRAGIGTRLGRFWPTISVAVRVAFIGIVFGLVFQTQTASYITWVASGFIAWTMLSSSITLGSSSIVSSKGYLLSIPLPAEALVFRVVAREFLMFLQNLTIMAGVLVVARMNIIETLLLIIPGLIITVFFLMGVGMILGPMVAKFKDWGQFVSAVVGVLFFVLPIMWQPDQIQSDLAHLILGLNPLYHYLQIIRLPLVNELPTQINYLLALTGSIVSFGVGMIVMNTTREKLVYWA